MKVILFIIAIVLFLFICFMKRYSDGLLKKAVYFHEIAEKQHCAFDVAYNWLLYLGEGKTINTYFQKKGYKKIGIYVMDIMGEYLFDQLAGTDVRVEFLMGNPQFIGREGVMYIGDHDQIPRVDAIIVSSAFYYENIKNRLKDQTETSIISIKDLFVLGENND